MSDKVFLFKSSPKWCLFLVAFFRLFWPLFCTRVLAKISGGLGCMLIFKHQRQKKIGLVALNTGLQPGIIWQSFFLEEEPMAISLGLCSCTIRFPQKLLCISCWRKNSCLAAFWQLGGAERRSSHSVCKFWVQSPVFHLSWVHLLYSSQRGALRLLPEGRRGRSGERDLRLYLNRLSTSSCIF